MYPLSSVVCHVDGLPSFVASSRDSPQNVLDAAARGAQDAVPIVLAVGATLIAFLSILEFLNAVLSYLGSLVEVQNLTLDVS